MISDRITDRSSKKVWKMMKIVLLINLHLNFVDVEMDSSIDRFRFYSIENISMYWMKRSFFLPLVHHGKIKMLVETFLKLHLSFYSSSSYKSRIILKKSSRILLFRFAVSVLTRIEVQGETRWWFISNRDTPERRSTNQQMKIRLCQIHCDISTRWIDVAHVWLTKGLGYPKST